MKKYDAIVIGTGISGGWAAKELCEKGLNTLVLDRGRNINHGDYPTANKEDWELTNHGKLSLEELKDYPVQKRAAYLDHSTKDYWVKDIEDPYIEDKPFDWIRGNHVGGRSLTWGRQVYRWSDLDFEANGKEGIAIDWPIMYKDIAPWYDYVESFIGVSGMAEGLAHLPDGNFLPPMDFLCIEEYAAKKIREIYDDRIITMGRVANLTVPHKGRGSCQYRDRCIRGCPIGAYFSSQSSTLPAAAATGNMELRPYSMVTDIEYDESIQYANKVKGIDGETGEFFEFSARLIFLNASTLGSTQILLNSLSSRFPNGLGNDSGQLGHNLMDHHCYAGASGDSDLFKDQYFEGKRANVIYLPRFKNVNKKNQTSKYKRGFAYQGSGAREGWWRAIKEAEFGVGFKEASLRPGKWQMGLIGFGECLPHFENKVTLDAKRRDKYGMPLLKIDMKWRENEIAMREDMVSDAGEILENLGFQEVTTFDHLGNPGGVIHEMGTVWMGHDPKSSILNKWNQMHSVKNLFVTDGSCMTSSACQNPSLTYMALTARAVNYAVEQLRKGNL